MISYLLWLYHHIKGSSSNYGTRSQLKSCKMNTCAHERVNKEHVTFVWKYDICSQLISSSTAWGCGACGGAGTWVVHPILALKTPDHVIESININESKIPVTISLKIHQIKPLPLHLFMSLLWLMWWTFFEIKWFESSCYMPIHGCLFVCWMVVRDACAHACMNPC